MYKSLKDYLLTEELEHCKNIIECFKSDIRNLKIQLGRLNAKLLKCDYIYQVNHLVSLCKPEQVETCQIEFEILGYENELKKTTILENVYKMSNLKSLTINCILEEPSFYDLLAVGLNHLPKQHLEFLQIRLKNLTVQYNRIRSVLVFNQLEYSTSNYLAIIGSVFRETSILKVYFNPSVVVSNSPSNKGMFEHLHALLLNILKVEQLWFVFSNDFIYENFFSVFKATAKMQCLKKINIQTSRIQLQSMFDTTAASHQSIDTIREQFLRQLMIFQIDLPDLNVKIR